MRIRPGSPLMTLACAALFVAPLTAAPRNAVAEDPRIDGLIPTPVVNPDPNILSDQRTARLPGVRPYTPPPMPTANPATTAAPASLPATGPESAPAAAPGTGPEASTTSAPASAPASATAPATAPL